MQNEKEFRKVLRSLPVGMRQRGLVDALRQGGNVVIKRARQLVPKETKALMKSLGQVMRNARSKHKDPYSVVGPRVGARYVREGRKPWKYAHLVEFKPKAFLRPAFGQHQAIRSKMTGRLSTFQAREAERLRRRYLRAKGRI